MSQKILLKRSSVVDESGNPKLPEANMIDYGEIAVNYASGVETLSIKNSNDEIVTFSSDNNRSHSDSDIPTLENPPTSSTVTRPDGSKYAIGDEVRVVESKYSFYKLYAIKDDGSAVWEKQYVSEANSYPEPYWISINGNIFEPSTFISSGISNSSYVIEYIKRNTHRYLCKYDKINDVMYICQLDDDDTSLFDFDKTNADISGKSGDVFTKIPKFYYKFENGVDEYSNRVGFSLYKIDDGWKEYKGDTFIASFLTFVDSGRTISTLSGRTYSSRNNESYDYSSLSSKFSKQSTKSDYTYNTYSVLALLYYAYNLKPSLSQYISRVPNGSYLNMVDNDYNFFGVENYNQESFISQTYTNDSWCVSDVYDNNGDRHSVNLFSYNSSSNSSWMYANGIRKDENNDIESLYLYYTYGGPYDGSCFDFSMPSRDSNSYYLYSKGTRLSYSNYSSKNTNRMCYVGKYIELNPIEYKKANEINNGIYIQDSNNSFFKKGDEPSNTNFYSIVLVTDKVKLLMQFKSLHTKFFNYDTNYTACTKYAIKDEAINDFNGFENFNNILSCLDSNSGNTNYTFGYANRSTFSEPTGNQSYLPSLGELIEIYNHKDEIDDLLSSFGQSTFSSVFSSYNYKFISSTYAGDNMFYGINFKTGEISTINSSETTFILLCSNVLYNTY